MIEERSETWQCVAAFVDARIEKMRAEIEKRNTSPEDTLFYRGQLSALRDVLALKNKAPESRPH